MDHSRAIAIFEEIQGRPYRVSTRPNIRAENCFFKGIELIQRLGMLGYAVRGRVCETFWDDALFPREIVALYPTDIPCTHFFVEMEIGGTWKIVDPSFPPTMKRLGCTIGSFSGTPMPCFPVAKLYTQEENIRYQQIWENPAYIESYFTRCGNFLVRLNAWLESIDA